MKIVKFVIIIFVSLFLQNTYAQEKKGSVRTSFFNENWLNAIVSVETKDKENKIYHVGTGFLVQTEKQKVILVTASHVIKDKENLQYRRIDDKNEEILITDQNLINAGAGKWFFSENYDLACRIFGWPSDKKTPTVIPIEKSIPVEDIHPGAPLLVLGFPSGLKAEFHNKPLVRQGIVARSEKNKIIIDAFVFPGNSGGPVVYVPFLKVSGNIKSPLVNEEMLIGVISSYIPYQDKAISPQTGRTRITFEENSGLSEVIPIKAVQDLISRQDIKKQGDKFIEANKD
ncbi:MAG: trypsin-like peptidase domain-containing protein [Candidatus Omnitrophica bacterium]|nr:trypsin-like peptidase domain-containing protein [Candidatus Omnitrophota bacterium]